MDSAKERRLNQRRKRVRERYASDPEYRAKVLADNKARYAASTEKQKRTVAQVAEWRKKNPAALRAQRVRYNENVKRRRREDAEYRERENEHQRQRRARASNAYRSLRNVLFLLEQQGGRCAICAEWLPEDRSEVDVDHIVALVNGGTNDISNLQLVHSFCNKQKGSS